MSKRTLVVEKKKGTFTLDEVREDKFYAVELPSSNRGLVAKVALDSYLLLPSKRMIAASGGDWWRGETLKILFRKLINRGGFTVHQFDTPQKMFNWLAGNDDG